MTLADHIALDGNTLTYLWEGTSPGYRPSKDKRRLADEVVALVRCFFYIEEAFYLLPSVQAEYKRIKREDKRNGHDLLVAFHVREVVWPLDVHEVNQYKSEFQRKHRGDEDCLILAEARAAEMNVVLTCDDEFVAHLATPAKPLSLLRPSLYWKHLQVPRGTKPRLMPGNGHPLFNQTWWHWE